MESSNADKLSPTTLGTMIESWLDLQGKLRVSTMGGIKRFSESVGHSLDYQARRALPVDLPTTYTFHEPHCC